MRMQLPSLQTDHTPRDRLPSITALLTRLIMCIGVGFVASILFHYFWFATVEPFIYPCPYSNSEGICVYDPNKPEPELPIWFFS